MHYFKTGWAAGLAGWGLCDSARVGSGRFLLGNALILAALAFTILSIVSSFSKSTAHKEFFAVVDTEREGEDVGDGVFLFGVHLF